MANSFASPPIIACIFLAFLLSDPSLACQQCKITNYRIKEVCSMSQNPDFCLQFLKSNSAKGEADLTEVAQMTIDLANENGTIILKTLSLLMKKTNDPELKKQFVDCSESFGSAMLELTDVRRKWMNSEYYMARIAANAAMEKAESCKAQWIEPEGDELKVQDRKENFRNLCSVVSVIADYLCRVN